MTEDGTVAVGGGLEGGVSVWNVAAGRKVWTVRSGHLGLVAADRAGGRVFFGAGFDGAASLYDAAKPERLWRCQGAAVRVDSVGLSGDGKRALTGGSFDDGWKAILWDGATGKDVRTFSLKEDCVAALSRDGRRMLTVDAAGKVVVWDADSGEAAHRVQLGPGEQPAAALSPDGKRAVVSWRDGRVDVVDVGSPKHRTLQAHTNACRVALARGGRLLVTGAGDGTVGLWNLDRLTEVGRLVLMPSGTDWLVLAPDGRFDVSPGWRDALEYRVKGTNRFVPAAEADRKFRTKDLLRSLLAADRQK
jgi:WD40 repeat protein